MTDRPDMFRVSNPLQSVLSLAANPNDQEHAIAVMMGGHVATLTAQESLDMLHWLNEQRDALTLLALQSEPAGDNKAELYNREIDERNRIIAENREKPWLPFHDGE